MNFCDTTIPIRPQLQGDRPTSSDAVVRLPAGTVRAIEPSGITGAAGARVVRCVMGELWVTQTGNPADVVLGAGELFVAGRHGKIVVQALSDAAVWVV